MSSLLIHKALDIALNAMTPALATAWENVAFTVPVISTPYQKVNLLLATPENREFGSTYQEQGIYQISLFYPLQTGVSDALTRAELIRSTFLRGSSFTNSGVTVKITRTPEISAGTIEGDRWFIPVKIRFSAFIS